MKFNNETIGISAEIAIAETFNISVNCNYSLRANRETVDFLKKNESIKKIFEQEKIPNPIKHIAEEQNPVDFLLDKNKTLSVKTNKNNIGKASPQKIGQPTEETYFKYLEENNIIPNFNIKEELKNKGLEDNYTNRGKIFKYLSINYIHILINIYWRNMFDCDYLLLLYSLEEFKNPLNNYKVWGKMGKNPNWDKNKFTFTRNLENWNESSTLKYNGIRIGEFQVHNKRNCFKFRFDMKGISELIEKNMI